MNTGLNYSKKLEFEYSLNSETDHMFLINKIFSMNLSSINVGHNYEYVQFKQTLLKGMEYFFITCGEMSDILWRRNAGHIFDASGKNPFASRSKRRPCSGGMAYQVFGAPKCK